MSPTARCVGTLQKQTDTIPAFKDWAVDDYIWRPKKRPHKLLENNEVPVRERIASTIVGD